MLGKSAPVSDYYPSKLDQTIVGSGTQHTFLIYSKDDKHGAPHTSVLNTFLKHRVRILSQMGYADEKLGGYVLSLSCDLKNADISTDGLTLELRMLKSVTTAKSIKMHNRIFEGLFFPLTLLDKRVIALSAGITFLLEDRLKTRDEKDALVDVGRVYALGVVDQLRKQFPQEVSTKILQDNANDYFKTAGLGRFNIQISQEKSYQTTVLDPPLSETGQATGNHLLHGIIVGLIEGLENRSMSVIEDLYDAHTRRLSLHLVEKSITKKSNEQILKPTLPKEVQSQALDEVEKVIKSLENAGSDLDDRTPLVIEVRGGKSESSADTSTRPSYYTEREPSLSGMLKTYKDDGWVGGKIGVPPETGEPSHLIVAKYMELPSKDVDEISHSANDKEPEKLVEKVEPENAPEETTPRVTNRSSRKTKNDEEETEVYHQELRDDLFFEESY